MASKKFVKRKLWWDVELQKIRNEIISIYNIYKNLDFTNLALDGRLQELRKVFRMKIRQKKKQITSDLAKKLITFKIKREASFGAK